MKKILKLIVLLVVLQVCSVKATTFYEDNYITGVYANLVDGDFKKPQLMRFIRRKTDNKAAYCLTPRDTIYEDVNYTSHTNNHANNIKVSEEKYKRISQIAYFGYGYKNHTSNDWYAITQYMLWKEMDSKLDVFFTDKFKGNRVSKFTSEINEIENLIKDYNKLPNINSLNLTINKEYKIVDTNNVLNNYNIETSSDLNVKIENNVLKIKPIKKGNYKIKFIKKQNLYNYNTVVYTASKGQDILVTGDINEISKVINVDVTGGDLEIKKVDSETLSIENRGKATIVGAIYNLYDENKNLVKKLTINDDGTATIKDLTYGNYILKEIKAPIGYELDKKEYKININNNMEKLELKEDIIKGKLTIKKYLKDDNNLNIEQNIIFSIYDIDDNFVDKITTDQLGSASIELIYGRYKIVQENTTLGYKKVDDFYIDIDNSEEKIINLEDNIIRTNLRIIKKDKISKQNITLSNTYFKIKDLINNSYVIDSNNNDVFQTDEDGILNISIKGGRYLLEEIKSPNGYIIGDNIEFIIDENTKLTDNTLEIIVYNERQYGKIEIIKNGKLINNNLILLSDVKFNIYALEDIKLSDNTFYYKKDELVDTVITDINGKALSKELPIGKYYIVEISTLDNFIIDKNKYIIDFNNDINNKIVTKSLNVINNEKEIKEEKQDEYFENKADNKKTKNIIYLKTSNKENKNTIYPKTSNKDIYINTIISYLLFIGLILILASLKHEK